MDVKIFLFVCIVLAALSTAFGNPFGGQRRIHGRGGGLNIPTTPPFNPGPYRPSFK